MFHSGSNKSSAALGLIAMFYNVWSFLQVFGNKSYLEEAKRAGECVWERGILKKGYGICHGTAGNGYALLYLYQVEALYIVVLSI